MFRSLRKISTVLRQFSLETKRKFAPQNILCSELNFEKLIKRSLCTSTDSFYDKVDYDAITNGDSDLLKKLKIIMLEVEVLRQAGEKVPENMTTERWTEILHAKSKSQRIKQLGFWWLKEVKKKNDKEKKKIKRLAREESLKSIPRDNGHINYGFGGSTIFLRIYETKIDRWRNWKLMEAMLFNPTLVIDCGYNNNMNVTELSNCAKQLLILFAENRSHKDPFNLYFCNASRENQLLMKLNKMLPTMYEPDFPMNITEKSYTEMFPKEKLVYLTPHCREELQDYNYDDIYIIGALVDKVNNEPLSLAKAKAEGIRMARFPLDRYLDWAIGTKSLTINQSLNIMLDLKLTGDWGKALEHVPRRKLRNEEDNETTEPTDLKQKSWFTQKGPSFVKKAYKSKKSLIY